MKIGTGKPLAALLLTAVAVGLSQVAKNVPAAPSREWQVYGGNPESTRYSPLKQINRGNVGRLKVAWTYDVSGGRGGLQTNPIVVNGVVYGNTPGGKAIALDGASGKLIWSWDSKITGQRVRGLTWWSARPSRGGSDQGGTDRRIYAGFGRYVYALNAATGEAISGFGKDGRIDLHQDLDRDPEKESVSLTSPGIVYKDLLIVGGRESEGLPASYGDIRAYDTRSGALRWTFHTIPRPGEYGYETWPKDAWTYTGAANNWAGMSIDLKRGIVYVPTGSAASDFYGANRVGDDLFANCLLALDAATGKRIWHFQGVKHDIWDRDFPSPPTLVTVKHDGKMVDAVAQTSKQGYVFLFDRANGKPLFPVESRKYPPSTVEGEVAAETQQLPTKPAPFARQLLTADLLTNRTPEAHQWALEQFQNFRSEGQFVPLGIGKDTVVFPGYDGGAEWGGSAFDPSTGLLFVNANDVAWTGRLEPNTPAATGRDLYTAQCAVCHGADMAGNGGQAPALTAIKSRRSEEQITEVIQKGSGRMPGFPNLRPPALRALVRYLVDGESKENLGSAATSPFDLKYRFTGYKKFLDPEGYPAVAPPWGTLNAINLNTGEYAWKIPLGEYPELAEKGVKDTGSENYGGPIVTAGGLVFIGATNFDRKFRAFDKDTGKLLWETVMPAPGNATPATYELNGRQYVVIAAAGVKARGGGTAAVYVAFALPE
ncbi:MAG TPA: PQQ-binding-like beta-propeller repeat protein [Candidatus Acidoferrales bacterium]|jgi:quinoprotein glucose dehydrogenase|nr:PQQ-binding-like beta-propeller repeat protein [Candidatus Acidoferrales bacterium]